VASRVEHPSATGQGALLTQDEEGVVADYICVDGPLEGRLFRWRKPPRAGEPVTVALLDVEHAVLAVDYRVRPPAGPTGSGALEFVGAHDADVRRGRSLLTSAREAARTVSRLRSGPAGRASSRAGLVRPGADAG
jgi:hypothetical protein